MKTHVPPSREVLRHHATLHDDQCPEGFVIEVECPCGESAALCCSSCGHPVFMDVVDDSAWCIHARQLWAWVARSRA